MSNKIKGKNNSQDFEKLKQQINDLPTKSVAEKLGLQLTQSGNSLQGPCPTGHNSQNGKCFSINTNGNYWYCFNCGAGGDNIELVKAHQKIDFVEAVEWIATACNITHSVNLSNVQELSPEEKEGLLKAALYEKAFEWMHNLLFESDGKAALDYLVNERKYDKETLKKSEFCYFPEVQKIREYLTSELPEAADEISKLSLNGHFGDNFRLAIPYRNKKKLITGFLKRSEFPNGITVNGQSNVRWDSTAGLSKSDLFNLHNCKAEETLIVLEGYPDAIYFTALGMSNVCAVGQGKLSKKHIESLTGTKVKHIILSLDNDNSGADNTEAAIKMILEESDIKPFVLDPSLLGAHKDPDEFVRANGIDAFRRLVKKAESGVSWFVNRKLSGYNADNALNNEKILDEIIEFCQLVTDLNELDTVIEKVSKIFKYQKSSVKSKLREKMKVIIPVEDGDFWKIYPATGEVELCMVKYKKFLESNGIQKHFFGKEYMFLRNQSNIVGEFPEVRIKDLVIDYVQQQELKDSILELLLNNTSKYFGTSFFECVKTEQVSFKRDLKDQAFAYYKNGFVKLKKDADLAFNNYDSLDKPIWDTSILSREFSPVAIKYKQSEFERFLFNVAGKNIDRFLSVCSAMGYLIHDFKDKSNAKAVICCDERISEDPNGRTGKSLLGAALSKMKKSIRIDGKNFEFGSRFTFQQVSPDTKLIEFNDVVRDFDFEKLFSVLTDDITLEYKQMHPFTIPFEESPKILISTNYTIKGIGDSFKDRMFEIEFSDYYNAQHKPIDDFGHLFFDEWTDDEWNRFDNFMLECLQLYLDEGLIGYQTVNLKSKKLIDQTSKEFIEFFETAVTMGEEYDKGKLYDAFKQHSGYGTDIFNKFPIKQHTFSKWLKTYVELNKLECRERKSSGRYFIQIQKCTL